MVVPFGGDVTGAGVLAVGTMSAGLFAVGTMSAGVLSVGAMIAGLFFQILLLSIAFTWGVLRVPSLTASLFSGQSGDHAFPGIGWWK